MHFIIKISEPAETGVGWGKVKDPSSPWGGGGSGKVVSCSSMRRISSFRHKGTKIISCTQISDQCAVYSPAFIDMNDADWPCLRNYDSSAGTGEGGNSGDFFSHFSINQVDILAPIHSLTWIKSILALVGICYSAAGSGHHKAPSCSAIVKVINLSKPGLLRTKRSLGVLVPTEINGELARSLRMCCQLSRHVDTKAFSTIEHFNEQSASNFPSWSLDLSTCIKCSWQKYWNRQTPHNVEHSQIECWKCKQLTIFATKLSRATKPIFIQTGVLNKTAAFAAQKTRDTGATNASPTRDSLVRCIAFGAMPYCVRNFLVALFHEMGTSIDRLYRVIWRRWTFSCGDT